MGEKLSRRIQKRTMDSSPIESVGAFIYCAKTQRYLFLLRNSSKYAGTWGVVGGKVEANEQIIESLAREIEEENPTADNMHLLTSNKAKTDEADIRKEFAGRNRDYIESEPSR